MFYKIAFLAILQGLTEFLPVSSSGHSVIVKNLLGVSSADATLEVVLHCGSIISIVIFFRKELLMIINDIIHLRIHSENSNLVKFILVSSIPAGVIGIIWKDRIENLFVDPQFAAAMLVITGSILISTYFSPKVHVKENLLKCFLVGIAQAIAILPGISRSGATISTALWLKFDPKKAAQFSFLLCLPALCGAALLKSIDLCNGSIALGYEHLVGIILSAVVGYFALRLLLPILAGKKFWAFGVYCIAVGVFGLICL